MNILLVQPLGGLCNRMRVIVGAAVLASILNRKLVVIWTVDSTLNAKFSDLFEPIPYKVIDVRLGSFRQRALWHMYTKVLGYKVLDDQWIKKNARGKDTSTWIDAVIDQNILINSNLDIFLNGDYSIFTPLPSLLKELNTQECNRDVIGIHIRRTDNQNSIKFSPTQLFLEKVREEITRHSQVKFYLATDDPSEEILFQNEFGDKLLVYKKHSLDRSTPIAIKDALVDLYNLSCCKKIYGSYYSSFSDTASLWGGIEKTIVKNINI